MNEELKTKLERFLPIAVAVRLQEGAVQGRVEHSFSMDWSNDRVRVFWSGKAYSMIGEHKLNGVDDAKYNIKQYNTNEFVFDALSEDCPIEVDWEPWLADLVKEPGDKFAKRNARFTVKPHSSWQLKALTAERKLSELETRYKTVSQALSEDRETLSKIHAALHPEEVDHDVDA